MDRPDIERIKSFVRTYRDAQRKYTSYEGDFRSGYGQDVTTEWNYQRNNFPSFGSDCIEDLLAYVDVLEAEFVATKAENKLLKE